MSGKRAKKDRRAERPDGVVEAVDRVGNERLSTSRQLDLHLPGLLQPSSGADRKARHDRCATSATGRGVVFALMQRSDRAAVETLVRQRAANQHAYSMAPETGGVVARVDDEVVGAMVCSGSRHRGKNPPAAVLIQDLVVDTAWEGQGIGTVLLEMRHQLVDRWGIAKPVLMFGGCEPSAANFYANAGFFVLPPGTPLPHPVGSMHIPPEQTVYTSWFMDIVTA